MIHRTAGTLEVGFTRDPCRQLVAPWRVMLRPLRPAELVGRGFGDQCNVAPTSASHRSVAAHIRADPFGRPCALAETAAGKISQLSHVLGGANCSGRPPKNSNRNQARRSRLVRSRQISGHVCLAELGDLFRQRQLIVGAHINSIGVASMSGSRGFQRLNLRCSPSRALKTEALRIFRGQTRIAACVLPVYRHIRHFPADEAITKEHVRCVSFWRRLAC